MIISQKLPLATFIIANHNSSHKFFFFNKKNDDPSHKNEYEITDPTNETYLPREKSSIGPPRNQKFQFPDEN